MVSPLPSFYSVNQSIDSLLVLGSSESALFLLVSLICFLLAMCLYIPNSPPKEEVIIFIWGTVHVTYFMSFSCRQYTLESIFFLQNFFRISFVSCLNIWTYLEGRFLIHILGSSTLILSNWFTSLISVLS